MVVYVALSIMALLMTLRAFLVVIGTYKDPVLASFEHYGEEQIFSPIYSLTIWAAVFLYLSLFLYFQEGLVIAVGIIIVVPIVSFRDKWQDLLDRYPTLFRMFPHWYFELAQRTDREERRRIAYLWLRLPLATRLLYNANSRYFHLWVDLVLMSITR